jgi:protein-disulfide isomerase
MARSAHVAARCAGTQGKYWAYHDRLFAVQPRFESAELMQYAVDLGLDRETFARCLDGQPGGAAIDADIAQGRAMGVNGTPTFFINGKALVGAHPVESFRSAIEEILKGR